MTWTKWFCRQTTLTCTTFLALASYIDSFTEVHATHSLISTTRFADQPISKLTRDQTVNRLQASLKFILPPLPSRGAPGRRKGAASRGECPSVSKPLTALVPATGESSSESRGKLAVATAKSVLGLTAAEHPTFWFYVPYTLASERSTEFVLLDEQNNYVYKSTFTPTGVPGIISFRLPSTAAPLELGKMYHWYFLVNCDPDDPVFVEGWIQRVALNPVLSQQLAVAPPRERVDLYATNGIWYEALTTLAELYRATPADTRLATDWTTLLQAVDLNNITSEPLVSGSTTEK